MNSAVPIISKRRYTEFTALLESQPFDTRQFHRKDAKGAKDAEKI
jgi:hypothetical protein